MNKYDKRSAAQNDDTGQKKGASRQQSMAAQHMIYSVGKKGGDQSTAQHGTARHRTKKHVSTKPKAQHGTAQHTIPHHQSKKRGQQSNSTARRDSAAWKINDQQSNSAVWHA